MSEEENLKKDDKQTDVNVTVSYTAKQPVDTGTLTDIPNSYSGTKYGGLYIQKEGNPNGESYDFEYTPLEKPPLGLSELRGMYAENGGNAEDISNKLKQYILDNADNKEALAKFFGYLSQDLKSLYDVNKVSKNIGNNSAEILNNILSVPNGKRKDGFVCINVCELGIRLLHECGKEAVIMKGKLGEEHATLLYKNNDGKYTYINYGTIKEIDAPSIIEAAYSIVKTGHDITSDGSISFITEDGFYTEYPFKDESVWGEMLDKRVFNSKSLFDRDLPANSGIDLNIDSSSGGGISATIEGSKVSLDDNSHSVASVAIGYEKNGETANFNSSQSFGVKLGLNNVHKNGLYYNVIGVLDYTSGMINSREVATQFYSKASLEASARTLTDTLRENGYSDSEIEKAISNVTQHSGVFSTVLDGRKSNYVTGFIRGEAGVETSIYQTQNTNLKNALQISALSNTTVNLDKTKSYVSDFRISVEDGMLLKKSMGSTEISNEMSGGILFDKKESLGGHPPGVEIGAKFNAASSFYSKPSDNLSYGAGISGYSVFTKPSTDYGVGVNAFATYKPTNSDVVFSGSAGAKLDYQKLHLGGINEMTEHKSSFSVALSAKHKNNTFSLGYNGKFNAINSKRNESTFFAGYTRSF